MLGCIVVVKSSTLDPLYEGLPVVIVKHWSDVTQELLDSSLAKFSSLQDKAKDVEEYVRSMPRLQLKHWRDEISASDLSKIKQAESSHRFLSELQL